MKEKILIWLDRIIEYSLYGFIFTLPFSKSMVEIFFVSAFISWILKRILKCTSPLRDGLPALFKAFKPVNTALNLPIGAYILVGVLSTANSMSIPLSLEGLFFKLFEGVMIFFIVVEVIDSEERLRRVLSLILISIVFISADGIFQSFTGTDFIRGRAALGTGIQGPFDNPNGFAGWLVVMAPIALSLAYFGKKYKAVLCIISGMAVVSLFLTHAKGALIAFILSLVFLGLFKSKKLLIAIIVLMLALSFLNPGFISRFADSARKILEISKFDRPRMWAEALSVMEDFPLVGCGLNTYAAFMPIYPHNSYLHMAAEAGLLGLGAFIWIMVVLFKVSLENLKKTRNAFHSTVLIGFLAGLFGFLAHSFVEVNFFTLQLGNLMWFMAGFIIAVQNISMGGGYDQEEVRTGN
ncbi:MAG: O-antigen ligase family protein [Candidatus Omnitrophica bacterium]|nr:O-antigen ligase family protein [Candidatus Omnitrophota bacterium]